MSLVSICDNCYENWRVDSLVYVDAIGQNLCPVCVNQLVDLCFSQLTNAKIRIVKQEMEEL